MTNDSHLIEVVHSGAAEVPVGDREAGGFDNMSLDVQAGAEAENCPRVLRNVWLEQGYAHGSCKGVFRLHFLGKSRTPVRWI